MGSAPRSFRLEDVERLHLALLGSAVLAAVLLPWPKPGSVLAGGAVMGLNVWLMKGIVRRLLRAEGPQGVGTAMILLLLKFALLLGLLGLLFWRVSLDGMSFALGITLFLVAAVVEAVRASFSNQGEQ